MTRWLALVLDYPPSRGGIQTYLGELLGGLPAGSVEVIAPRPDRRAAPSSPLPGAWMAVPAMALKGIRSLAAGSFDGILCGHATLSPLALALGAVARIPTVVFAYGMEITAGRAQRLRQAGLRAASGVVAVSHATREVLVQTGVDPARIAVITPGARVPTGATQCATPCPSTSDPDEWPLGGRPRLLTCARLDAGERYKGHDQVLHALARLGPSVPEASYVIAGDGSDRPRLEALADSLGVASRVRFLGRVTDERLDRLYAAAEIFVMPSGIRSDGDGRKFEGFGIAFLEAAARGLPAIGGRSGGVPEAVVDERTGLLVDPGDVDAIAQAIRRLARDPALRRRLGEAARTRAIADFRWADRSRDLHRFLDGVVGQRRRDHGLLGAARPGGEKARCQ